ncbi:MAG: DNA (cytosine-5-)-methyltransferase [Candidatus Cloacimonetes bacterium]|nr:DNA (cytosine-5-)-methyltransferase [Candidatus Cloacimonadota bacterium]
MKKNFKYIDLFAGIGGFHQAMRRHGGKCVYFCEKNPHCVDVYNKNYNNDNKLAFDWDIKNRKTAIPSFDVLCAGFPCQSFSKAGRREGFNDIERGDLFYRICDILDEHPETKFVILENVRNLADNEANWDVIKKELMDRNFIITEEPIILSPHQFGIPQIRERVYILGIKESFKNKRTLTNGYIHREDLNIEEFMQDCPTNCIPNILDNEVDKKYYLPKDLIRILDAWSEFKISTKMGVIGKPIWLSCFGIGEDDTEKFRNTLKYYDTIEKEGEQVPLVPNWKKQYIDFNRDFYLKHRAYIDSWIERNNMNDGIKLHQKFEWNCGEDCENIRDGITQIRQSGVRVKRPNFFPSLVAMRNTPIIWDHNNQVYRYITPHEAAKLQSFDEGIRFHENDNETYKQLGNSVNVRIIEILAERLFKLGRWRKEYEKKN